MNIIWLVILLWFIICCMMEMFYRRLWIAFAGASLALFIAWKQVWCWFVIPASICAVLMIPFLLYDLKLSQIQNLRREIDYKEQGTQLAFDERQKLAKLEQVTLIQWVKSWFIPKNF